MKDSERVYGRVIVEAKDADNPDVILKAERKLPGDSPSKKTYWVKDNPAARPMTQWEAETLARDIAEGLERREELWAKQRARGRAPGGSRPKSYSVVSPNGERKSA